MFISVVLNFRNSRNSPLLPAAAAGGIPAGIVERIKKRKSSSNSGIVGRYTTMTTTLTPVTKNNVDQKTDPQPKEEKRGQKSKILLTDC